MRPADSFVKGERERERISRCQPVDNWARGWIRMISSMTILISNYYRRSNNSRTGSSISAWETRTKYLSVLKKPPNKFVIDAIVFWLTVKMPGRSRIRQRAAEQSVRLIFQLLSLVLVLVCNSSAVSFVRGFSKRNELLRSSSIQLSMIYVIYIPLFILTRNCHFDNYCKWKDFRKNILR